MQIRTSVISVGDVDTVKQEFSCDIYVSATWREPRLKGKKLEVKSNWFYNRNQPVELREPMPVRVFKAKLTFEL